MRRFRGRRGSAAVVAGAVLLVCGAVGAAFAANSAMFEDPPGDNNPGAPDITSVNVSNDDAGILTFRITLPNRDDLGEKEGVNVYLDIDRSILTGCDLGVLGADYIVGVLGHPDPRSDFASRSKGSKGCHVIENTTPPSLTSSFDKADHTLTVSIDRCDLRKPPAFYFLIATSVPGIPVGDVAANSGRWSYDIDAPDVPCDTIRPVVKAVASKGKRGKTALLRYYVSDNRGTTREEIRVYRRSRQVGRRVKTKLGSVTRGRRYAVRWQVPATVTGSLRFCVTAWDEWGNRSRRPSCAPLKIS